MHTCNWCFSILHFLRILLTLFRYADDARWNASRHEQMHWDDPARAFLTRRRSGRRIIRPEYEGPVPPPNRYGIRPGFRWDGVDRSNGFERKFLMSINQAQRSKAEHHGMYGYAQAICSLSM